MCGRYALVNGEKVFLTYKLFKTIRDAQQAFSDLPRYNAAPLQQMPVFIIRDGDLVAVKMQWWLVPPWAKENKPAYSSFNAKAESLATSKLFGPSFRGSRCLVPADAFYEWQRVPTEQEVKGKRKTVESKQPMCIRRKDELPFCFAGLFSIWKDREGKEYPTFAIITTEPNELIAPIHNRMPVILHEKDFEQWLDRNQKETERLKKLLVPYPSEELKAYPVSKIVNNARNDVPECLRPEKKE
jgi:putative SOS response-associated peptidase YedK